MASRTAKRSAGRSTRPANLPAKPDLGRWGVLAILVVATLATYLPLCWCDFTTWDDNQNVSHNPYLNPPTLEGVGHFWAAPHMFLYIPMTYTVWGALADVSQLDEPTSSGIWLRASVFHLGNVLVHLLAVLAAYQLLLALTRRRWPACAGALLFALHPVQVESVAWVAGMKDVLCGMFSICALWQYVRFAQGDADGAVEVSSRRRWLHYALATAALVLAMLSKPSAMTIPLSAAVLDRWVLRRNWWRIGAALWPWAILGLTCAFVAHMVQPVAASFDAGRIWQRPLLMGAALAFYLYKLVFPLHLAIQYHYSPQVLLTGRWIDVAWLIPVAVALEIWSRRKSAPWAVAAGLIFLLSTLPVLGLVPFQFERLSLTADHYLYVAMIGPALAVAFALVYLRGRSLKIAGGIGAAALMLLALRSALQTTNWRDTQTLFEHELSVNPSSETAFNTLASLAFNRNDAKTAEKLARQSLAIQPDQSLAYITLGSVLYREGRADEAMEAYRTAIDKDPDSYGAMSSLAGILAERGHIDQAMQLSRRAIEIEPTDATAHLNLSIMLARQNHLQEALAEAQSAVQSDRGNAKAEEMLGILFLQTGNVPDAVAHLQASLRLDPNIRGAREILASIPRTHQPANQSGFR